MRSLPESFTRLHTRWDCWGNQQPVCWEVCQPEKSQGLQNEHLGQHQDGWCDQDQARLRDPVWLLNLEHNRKQVGTLDLFRSELTLVRCTWTKEKLPRNEEQDTQWLRRNQSHWEHFWPNQVGVQQPRLRLWLLQANLQPDSLWHQVSQRSSSRIHRQSSQFYNLPCPKRWKKVNGRPQPERWQSKLHWESQ